MSDTDRYNSNVTRARRSPGGDPQSRFFQGQGGRTVLPPLSAAFPTSHFPVPSQSSYSQPYSQPRSSPGRGDYQFSYPQWTMNPVPSYQPSGTSYAYDDPIEFRYPSPPQTNYPSRASPTQHADNRRGTPPGASSEKWGQAAQYAPQPAQFPGYSSGRPPANTYAVNYPPPQYTPSHSPQYSYSALDQRPVSHQVPYMEQISLTEAPVERGRSSRPERSSSYTRSAASVPYPQPGSPTEETGQVKKKRKRADAAQLEVLNEVYNRTAFPSTEERAELARKLDMTPRSVQIWFQNKRQAMRQTSKQPTAALASSQCEPFVTTPSDLEFEDTAASVSGYDGGMTSNPSNPYPPRLDGPSQSPSRGSPKEALQSRAWGRY